MNEILQWICILIIMFVMVVPKLTQVVRDFREEEEE